MRVRLLFGHFRPVNGRRVRSAVLATGAAVLLAGCGPDESTDFSANSLSTQQQAVASVQVGSPTVSQLDISPPTVVLALPAKSGVSDATYVQAAQAFAAQNAARYGLAAGAPGFEVLSIKRSL